MRPILGCGKSGMINMNFQFVYWPILTMIRLHAINSVFPSYPNYN